MANHFSFINNKPIIQHALAGLFAVLIFAWLGWTLLDEAVLRTSFVHGSYLIILTLLATWAFTFSYYLKRSDFQIKEYWQEHKVGILFVLALVAFVFLSVTAKLRVFSDESNLASIAMSMAFENTVYNSTMGLWYYDAYHAVTNLIPKRPLVFPTLVSVVHTLTGYRVENAFIVNGIALTALLWLVYLVTARRLGKIAGYCACLFVLTQPVVSITATSGGFDILSTCFALITAIAFARYVDKPSALTLALLWITFLVFANIRYESLVYAGVMAVALLIFRKIRWQDVKANLVLIGPSLLWLLPTIWQRILSQGKYENPDDRGVLSLEAMGEHFEELIEAQTMWDFVLPYAPVLTYFAIAVAIFWLGYWAMNKPSFKGNDLAKFSTLFVCLAINLSIFLAHHNGYFHGPTSVRFYLIFSIALAWLPVTLFTLPSERLKKGLLGLAGVLFLTYHSAAMTDKTTKKLLSGRNVALVNQVIAEQPTKNFLLITSHPGRHTIQNIGAVNFSHARRKERTVLRDFKNYLHEDIIVAQRIDQATGKPIDSDKLPESFKLEPYRGMKFRSNQYLLISKVVRETE
ncbi:glycosyltransferase family 39 protein [Catenovulum sp. SM1970]|uniref:glycosyltransferase family 39 protein n=1 Tax=Marinifaba aquimaris TaxID=2741323 RepID=UPI001573FADE|nr:glycosyltransferase family 39 protein [Marinifaba aquimaris]NTS75944.1 glycosyltransferase family 39 protein [Marinifaba aquimaris]